MSNCIDLRDNVVRFTSADIDIDALFVLLGRVSDTRPSDAQVEENAAWWYLKTCTVLKGDGSVHISFGEGRSTHTWRDFEHLINFVINPLMKRHKSHTFLVKEDGCRGFGRWTVTFGQFIPGLATDFYKRSYSQEKCPRCHGAGKVHIDAWTILETGEKVRGIDLPCEHVVLKPRPSQECYCTACNQVLYREPKGGIQVSSGNRMCDCSWRCCDATKEQKHAHHHAFRESTVMVGEFTRVLQK